MKKFIIGGLVKVLLCMSRYVKARAEANNDLGAYSNACKVEHRAQRMIVKIYDIPASHTTRFPPKKG